MLVIAAVVVWVALSRASTRIARIVAEEVAPRDDSPGGQATAEQDADPAA